MQKQYVEHNHVGCPLRAFDVKVASVARIPYANYIMHSETIEFTHILCDKNALNTQDYQHSLKNACMP